MIETAVIGGGIAGLTAALFSARCGRSTVVFISDIPGGHLATIDRVEDFPGFLEGIAGYDLGPTIQEQASRAGAEFRMGEVERLIPNRGSGGPHRKPISLLTSDGEVEALTVIVAAGSHARALGIPGEERFYGRGISHCASCDGPLLHDKPAMVVGGGDSAFQEALTLAGFASEVLVVHQSTAPTAQEVYQQRVRQNARIVVRGSAVVEELTGAPALEAVRVRDTVANRIEVVETSGLFVYVGLEPNTGFLQDLLRLDGAGRIPTDICMRTELAGVFAAGDVRSDSASQAVTAAGDGATAALAAHRYLKEIASVS